MECVAEITDLCLNWKLLPKHNYPMLFEDAAGEAEQETNCTRYVHVHVRNSTIFAYRVCMIFDIELYFHVLDLKHENFSFKFLAIHNMTGGLVFAS